MEKKTALITGSYGGLGACFAQIHAAGGGDLILVGRNTAKLVQQATALHKTYGAAVNTIAVDLSTPDAAQKIHDTCVKNGWQVDYLINNAGFGGQGDFARERKLAEDLSMVQVNVATVVALCKLFLPDFVARGSGRVLNVSSTASLMPGPLEAVYFATKAFVTSFSNSLWRELRGTGVTVTALLPGAMKTGFIERGNLGKTKLFAVQTKPDAVAKVGYRAMLHGKINAVAGLLWWQRLLVPLVPLLPKKLVLNVVFLLQENS